MKTEKNILVAFLLNLSFSIFELIGGMFTNSVAIISDAVHDLGDSFSIGLSYFLEKKSKRRPDEKYTYGYMRYSVLGAIITNSILVTGSVLVIYNAVLRLINPVDINYNGMIIFAVFGVVVNFLAAYFTREGDSLNQKAVNLHMMEDVLGWIVVLIGALVIKVTEINIIDSILSIGVAIYIFIHALTSFKDIVDLFLTKVPSGVNVSELSKHILEIDGVEDVHHVHVWSMDGVNNYATMHVVSDAKNISKLKKHIREELEEHGINHVTIEVDNNKDECSDKECEVKHKSNSNHHHHHHH